LERLICDIDFKIVCIFQKLSESLLRVHQLGTMWLNSHMKRQKKDERYMTFFDTISVSEKAKQSINRIINEDRKKGPTISHFE